MRLLIRQKLPSSHFLFLFLILFGFTFSPLVAEHNFSFEFANDTLIRQLNWQTPQGRTKRIAWDEYWRFNQNGGPGSIAWLRQYLHCTTGGNTSIIRSGWRYNFDYDFLDPPSDCNSNPACQLMQEAVHTTTRADITYEFLSAPNQPFNGSQTLYNDDEIQIHAFSTDVDVVDHLAFDGDLITLSVTITNRSQRAMKVLEVPIYLGGLMIGNYDMETYRIITSDARLSRFRPVIGGLLEQNYTNPAGGIWDNYPRIGVFSPIGTLGGSAKFEPGTNVAQPGEVMIGGQFLTEVELPDTVAFRETPYNQFSPVLSARIQSRNLAPNESRTYVLAYQIVEGANNWQGSLQPYKNWFNRQYGTLNAATQTYEPTPNYCPTGPFDYAVGSNFWPNYDFDRERYIRTPDPNQPGQTQPLSMRTLFRSHTAPIMRQMGFERFGIWKTALNSMHLASQDPEDPTNCLDNHCEFNPNIKLIDPNLDISMDNLNPDPSTSLIKDFTDQYENNDMSVFWFLRPCMYIEGADVLYDGTENPPFIPGVPDGKVDLTDVAKRDRAISMMEFFVQRGVRGFYIDAAGCPGDAAMLSFAKYLFQQTYGADMFYVKEGAIDREALLWPQMPLIKTTGYNYGGSQLLNFLVPDGTFYGGAVNATLNTFEMDDILEKGYQAVPLAGPRTEVNPWLCSVLRRSYQNYHDKWEHYGQAMSCPEPILEPPACVGVPETSFTVHASVSGHGRITPTGDLTVLEGGTIPFTFQPDLAHHLQQILVDGNPVTQSPNGTYYLTVRGNHVVQALFEPDVVTHNQPPIVHAGEDQIVTSALFTQLNGRIEDDGLPDPPRAVTSRWSLVSGPVGVAFVDPSRADTTVSFPSAGLYVLRLSASDSLLDSSDEVRIVVLDSASRNASENQTRFLPCANPREPMDRAVIPICYSLREAGHVKMSVYNRLSNKLITLIEGEKPTGPGLISWDGMDENGEKVASGVYTVILERENEKVSTKVVIIK